MDPRAVVVLPAVDLSADISVMEDAGFVLTVIFPADDPRRAEMSGHGINVVLEAADAAGAVPAPAIELAGVEPFETSGGVRFIEPRTPAGQSKRTDAFVHSHGGDFGTGRAGMEYRDLVPDRHGGRVIASHIRVPGAGPVPDYVHFHDISFQMIWCLSGRVKLVYEDQGDPFWMEAGDCVVQPPGIRHRVLESEDDLEVIEVALPAEHRTTIDHELELPNADDPGHDYGGQRFVFDQRDQRKATLVDGWTLADTQVETATKGLATARTIKATAEVEALTGCHSGDLCLFVVLSGTAVITSGDDRADVQIADSVAIKDGATWEIAGASSDFEALHIHVGEAT